MLSHRKRAVRLSELGHVRLNEPVVALRLVLDAERPPDLAGVADVEIKVERPGAAHAIVCWWTAQMDRFERPASSHYRSASFATISTAPVRIARCLTASRCCADGASVALPRRLCPMKAS